MIAPSLSFALPQNASVKQGAATISSSSSSMLINQQSERVSIDYQGFSIAANEQVIFQQPSVNSVALNRVLGNDPSNIFGVMQSNGQVFLINPNGIVFGEGAHIDVGGLVASTLDMSDEDFMSGMYRFSGEETGAIVNEGLIQAARNGLLVFIADHVVNHGEMIAENGHIELMASDEVTVDMSDGVVSILSTKSSVEALIENHGLVEANGGVVVFNADAMDALQQTVVNNTGIIRATSVEEINGEIYIRGGQGDLILDGEISANGQADTQAGSIELSSNRIAVTGEVHADGDQISDGGEILIKADDTIVLADEALLTANAGETGVGGEIIAFSPGTAIFHESAKLEAKGGSSSGDGGFIEVSGLERVEIYGLVDTSATNGETGTFYIDPYDITISAAANANGAFDAGSPNSWLGSGVGTTSTINTTAITAALAASDVIINTALGTGTGTGNITVNNDIDLNGGDGNTLSLIADGSIELAALVKIADSVTASPDAVNVNLTAGGNLTLNNDADIQTTGGNATVVLGGNFITFGSSSINTGNGLIDITAADVDLIGALVSTSSAANAVTVNSGDQIQDSGAATVDISAVNGGVVLNAFNGISVDIDAVSLSVANTASGNIVIDEDNSLQLTSLVFQGGDATISTLNGGYFFLNADVDLDGLNGSTLTFASTGNLDTDSGNQITDSNSGTVDAVDINLSAGSNMLVRVNNDIHSSGGNITINVGGTFDTRNATLYDAGSGQISITANDVSLVSSLVSTSALSNAISIVSSNTIVDGGAANVDVQAISGGAVLQAVNGINLDTRVASLSLTNSASGAIVIEETDALEITSLTSAGSTSITSGGALTIPDAGLNTGSSDLALTATDIIDSDRSVILTADTLTLNTQTTGGDSVFNTTASSLDATNSGTNQITVNETDNLTLANWANAGDSLIVAGGVLTIPDAGLNEGGDSLSIIASDIIDSDRVVTLAAGALLLNTQTVGGNSTFNTTATILSLTNGGTNQVAIAETDALTVVGLSVNGDTVISAGGVLTAPDAGLNVGTNALSLTASDIIDSDRALTFAAGALTLSTQTAGGDSTFNTTATSLDLTNGGTNQVTIVEADALSVTGLSANGATVISAGGVLTAPDAGLNVGTNALSLTATDFVDVSGRIVDLTAGTLTLNTQTVGGNSTFNTTATGLDLTNTGTNQITVNETDNLTLANWANAGDSVIAAGGVLTIPDAGLNEGTDSLSITASDIIDSDRVLTLAAGALTLNTQTAGGDSSFNTTATSLDLTNGGTNQIILNETDNLAITNWSNAGDSVIGVGGALTIPDLGISVGGNSLVIASADIQDVSGRTLDFVADQLSLDIASPVASLTLNTDVNDLQVYLGSASDLSVNEVDALNLSDVNGLGGSIELADGQLIVNSSGLNVLDDIAVTQGNVQLVSAGSMLVNANISASDTNADAVREGLIDLAVNNGGLVVGSGAAVSIISSNNVDQTVGGGLGADANSQVGIMLRQIDTGESSNNFVLGDGVGSDVLIRAVGSDVAINSVNNDAISQPLLRAVIMNSDATIQSYNQNTDAEDGTVVLAAAVNNGASTQAFSGRSILVNPGISGSTAIDSNLAEIEGIISSLTDQKDDLTSTEPLDSNYPSLVKKVEADQYQVSNTFQRAFDSCSADDRENKTGNCRVNDLMVQFLSGLIVGGALPSGKN